MWAVGDADPGPQPGGDGTLPQLIAIIAEAISLFARRGLRGTTWDDIAEAAGFTRRSGTIFNYFRSKPAIVGAAVEATLANLEHRPPRPAIDDPVEDARAWAAALLVDFRRRRS